MNAVVILIAIFSGAAGYSGQAAHIGDFQSMADCQAAAQAARQAELSTGNRDHIYFVCAKGGVK